MSSGYASAVWTVAAGSADEFVERWQELLTWAP